MGRDADKLSQVQKELTGSKAQLSILTLDMLDQVALESFVESLDADLLVNCAGLAYFSRESDLDSASEQDLGQVNYHSPVQLIQGGGKKESEDQAGPAVFVGSSFFLPI